MPEKKPLELVRMVESGEIDIPELQREFVWSDEQVKDLAESIYKGYPMGLLTLYKLPRDLEEQTKASYWVLDGQQRLLSLTLMLNGSVRLKGGEEKKLWVWFNPKEENFRCTEPLRKLGEGWVNLSDILKMKDENLVKYIEGKTVEEREKINLLWLRFRGYNVLFHELAENLDLDMLGDIFVRSNFAGTRVKGSDVYSTMVAIAAPGMVKDLRAFVDELKSSLGWDIDYGILIRTFIAFLTKGRVKLASRVLDQASILKENLASAKKNNIMQDLLKITESGVKESIKILMDSSELAIIYPTYYYFPTQNVLVTMAYYLANKGLSQKDKRGLLAWFILASQFGRYSSATETRLNEDLSIIQEGGDHKALISKLEERTGNLKVRLKEAISIGLVYLLPLYGILKMNKAKDMLTQNEITTTDLTIHHIFPESILSGSEFEGLINDVGNLTLLTMGTNNRLRSERPSNYLPRIPLEIRKAHLIPENPELWKTENYKQFLEERKKLIIDAVDNFWKEFILQTE